MKTEILLSPRFTGERFSAHALPLALLKDLEALQGIIVELARADFVAAHPHRQRLPRGFGEALTLHLVGVEGGSFTAHVGLSVSDTVLPGLASEVEVARSACRGFLRAVSAAQSEAGPLPALPDAVWPHIERFGRGLRDGESIDLGILDERRVAITREVRRRLLLTRTEVQAVTDELRLTARLGDVRPKEKAITLELPDERSVVALVSTQQLHDLRDVRVGELGSAWLAVEGIGSFDRALQLQRVDEVRSVELLDPLDPRVQVERLRQLREGWLDGERGLAMSRSLLNQVEEWLDLHLAEDAPLPRLYPTPEGGVEAEWLVGRVDLSIEFDPITRRVQWHAMNLDTDLVDERAFDLGDAEGLNALGEMLVQTLASEAARSGEVTG